MPKNKTNVVVPSVSVLFSSGVTHELEDVLADIRMTSGESNRDIS
jgi:hypothetical protein